MKKLLTIILMASVSSQSLAAEDILHALKDMVRKSEDYRELTVSCLAEMEISKARGWSHAECRSYEAFATSALPEFQKEIGLKVTYFAEFSKSKEVSSSKIKRGLKSLYIIKSNMENIGTLSAKIKSVVQAKD